MRRLISLSLVPLLLILLNGCGNRNGSTAESGDLSSVDSQVEAMINNYDKLTNQYVHLSKKLKDGDVSVTVRYIEVGKQTRQESAQLKEVSSRMTQQQAHRVASISARTAGLMQE